MFKPKIKFHDQNYTRRACAVQSILITSFTPADSIKKMYNSFIKAPKTTENKCLMVVGGLEQYFEENQVKNKP